MNLKERLIVIAIIVAVAWPVGVFFTAVRTHAREADELRTQAILHHAAHYESDAQGRPVFRWNDEK